MGETAKIIVLVLVAILIAIFILRYGFDIDIINEIKIFLEDSLEKILP